MKRTVAYVSEIYRHVKSEAESMKYLPPSYASTRRMMYVLRKLELVRTVRLPPEAEDARLSPEEKKRYRPRAYLRKFYRIWPGKERDIRWRDPIMALYEPERFERIKTWPRFWIEEETAPTVA